MKFQKRIKILTPTLREKKRYIAVKLIAEEPLIFSDIETAIKETLLHFYGSFVYSTFSLKIIKNLFNQKENIVVLRCNNLAVNKVLLGISLIARIGDVRVIPKIIRVSGTIKSLGKVIKNA